jgi:L-iditol 2-dehydrogenase
MAVDIQEIPKTMRAAVLFGPQDIRVVEKPVPRPGPGEVLVKVAACAICGTDLKILAHPDFLHPARGEGPRLGEFTPGHEYSGTVVAVGETVDEVKVGDRVAVEAHKGCGRCENCIMGLYTACLNYGNVAKGHRTVGMTVDGGFAEYVINHVNTLYKVPDNISFAEATLVTTAGTPIYAIDQSGGLVAGETVAVLGPGPIGLMAVQVCRAMGADTIFLTGTRPSRLELGKQMGADVTINVRETDPVEVIMDHTRGRGVDLVLECAGGPESPDQAVRMAKRGGRVVFVAYYKGPVTLDLNVPVRNNVQMYTIRGEGRRACARALSMMSRGLIQAAPFITHRFPLEAIGDALRTFAEDRDRAIKVVVEP